jgi:phage-related minor tail protein
VAADTAGVFDTLGNAMKNVTAIDIRDYFGAAAEAVAGDGVDGSPSLTNALTEAQERMKSIADTMKDAFTSGFMSIIDGTKSAKDAFRDMARSIIAKLYEVLVVQRLVGSFDAATGTGTGLVGMIMGAFGGFRANGGPVSGGTPYIVGERGPELFVPSRSGTIVPNGAGGGVTVIQNNTFGNGVSRAEIQSMLPRIVETTKAAVFDAQRRSVNGLGYA